MHTLDEETLKAFFLKFIRDEWIDLLNLMGKRDISELSFRDICDLCIHISRGKARNGKNPRDHVMSRINKSIVGTISRDEIDNFLENFKKIFWGVLLNK